MRRFLERPPQNDGAWFKHPALAGWHETRAPSMDDPDASLPM
jgi:hypothetical protein